MRHNCKYFLLELLPALIITAFCGRISFVILTQKKKLGKVIFTVFSQINGIERKSYIVMLWGEIDRTCRIS